MLSSGTTCYHLGLNVIICDEMLSSGANVIIWDKMLSSGANVIIWCYHVMLSSGMITHPFFIFPENFTHSKFGTCTLVSVNGTFVEAKMCTLSFTLESTHFIFNKCPIYTHDGASAKFSTNSHETDYSAYHMLSQGPLSCKFLAFQKWFQPTVITEITNSTQLISPVE